jgi:hypothetical protein
MLTDVGAVDLQVPRDRAGTFEPQIVRKGQTRLEGFNERIIALSARGRTTRDIRAHLREMYDVEVSPDLISRVTDGVLDELAEWQGRPLDPCIRKTNRKSEPDPGQGSWQPCATSPSAPCAWPGAPTSPKPPNGPAGPSTGHSPSSSSPNDLETAVPDALGAKEVQAAAALQESPQMVARADRAAATHVHPLGLDERILTRSGMRRAE